MKRVWPLLLALLACREPPSGQDAATRAAPYFVDATAEVGLDFVHWNGMVGEKSIVEEMGSGGALFDVDGDGDLDLYLVQGGELDGSPDGAKPIFEAPGALPLSDRLYRNLLVEEGALRFVDATEAAGLRVGGYGMGVAVGDVDDDGDPDLYITQRGPNELWINQSTADRIRFVDATEAAGVGDPRWSIPATFVDLDGDGRLDLYVGNYVAVPDPEPVCYDTTGARDYCGPDAYTPEFDRVYRNLGPDANGMPRFVDATLEFGFGEARGRALAVVAADFDGDHAPELYVANDGNPNHLWRRAAAGGGAAVYVDVALLAGAAVNADGAAEASMGVAAADFDGNGALDLFLTHFVTETNTLYLGDGKGFFEDRTLASGLGPPSRLDTSFGTVALDADRDGRLDLLVVSGAVNTLEAQARAGDPFPLRQPNRLFLQGSEGLPFAEVDEPSLGPPDVSRGALLGDVDNDGDLDVVVTNNSGPARLLLGARSPRGAWLGLRLVERTVSGTPRDAVGARVDLLGGAKTVDSVKTVGRMKTFAAAWPRRDGSYASSSDPRVLWNAVAPAVDGARVVWPGGETERFELAVRDRYVTLTRGEGVKAED